MNRLDVQYAMQKEKKNYEKRNHSLFHLLLRLARSLPCIQDNSFPDYIEHFHTDKIQFANLPNSPNSTLTQGIFSPKRGILAAMDM